MHHCRRYMVAYVYIMSHAEAVLRTCDEVILHL